MKTRMMSDGTLRLGPVKHFDPVHVFTCGQCFRWEPLADGRWQGISSGHALWLSWDGSCLQLAGDHVGDLRGDWIRYFDLMSDYGDWKRRLSVDDPVMQAAIRFGHGLRLLRQDPWETLASFLISQNNGIPRIRQIVAALCAQFGDMPEASHPEGVAASAEMSSMRSFPSAARIAALNESDLDVLRAGYRAPYLLRTARQIAAGEVDLAALGGMPLQEARDMLLRLHGVGIKVADCTLLFSGMHRDVFPVDRWVLRLMDALYPGSGTSTPALQRFADARWGELAGLAQQYLFFYARENRIGI